MTKPTIKSILLNSISCIFLIATNTTFSMIVKNSSPQNKPNPVYHLFTQSTETKEVFLITKNGELKPSEKKINDDACTKYDALIEKRDDEENNEVILKIWPQGNLKAKIIGLFPAEAQIKTINELFAQGESIFRIDQNNNQSCLSLYNEKNESTSAIIPKHKTSFSQLCMHLEDTEDCHKYSIIDSKSDIISLKKNYKEIRKESGDSEIKIRCAGTLINRNGLYFIEKIHYPHYLGRGPLEESIPVVIRENQIKVFLEKIKQLRQQEGFQLTDAVKKLALITHNNDTNTICHIIDFKDSKQLCVNNKLKCPVLI